MKRFLTFALACFPLLCLGAPSISYTTYFNNTHTYTNSTTAGTNSASRGVFTNSLSSAGFNTSGTTNATLTGNLLANGGVFTNGITAGVSTFNNGTLTASAPVLEVSQTWNNAGITFTGAKFNMTSTASGNNSLIQDWQLGGVSVGFMRKDGTLAGNALWVKDDALPLYLGASFDTRLYRDGAANTLALRNGANAQTFNVYNTYTDASNYERLFIGWAGNVAIINSGSAAGTGTARLLRLNGASLALQTGGASRWNINSSGHILAESDNAYDIGASGATRPRNIYAGTSIRADGNFQFSAGGGTGVLGSSPSEGVLLLRDFAATSFNRLQFGGTTTNFNAIAAVTNVAGKPYLKFTDATGANLRKIVNVGHQGGYTNVLSDAVATSVFYIAVPSTNIVAGKVVYEIAATDGTDTQGISGECKFVAVGKTTTVTAQIADVQTTAAVSAGTLTTALAANVATNNVLAITIDANTSLSTTNLVAKWRVESAGLFDVNQVIP